jgi:hypothetical protein
MAQRPEINSKREEINKNINSQYAVASGKTTGIAGATLAARVIQSDGTKLDIGFESHHGKPAIILVAYENIGGNALSLLNALKSNNWALTQAMRSYEKNSRGGSTDKNIQVSNIKDIMNLSYNTKFTTKSLHKLFLSFLAGLTEIGHDGLSQDIQEIMEAQYAATLEAAL